MSSSKGLRLLFYDGHRLYVSQWYSKKVLALGAEGQVERVITIPHGICGQVFVDGLLFLVTTDDEEKDDYWLTCVDPRPATPSIKDLVRVPFAARALAFDGTRQRRIEVGIDKMRGGMRRPCCWPGCPHR